MLGFNSDDKAYLAPFVAFVALLALGDIVRGLGDGFAAWPLAEPRYWVNPLQTVVCGILVARYWSVYQLTFPNRTALAVAIGVVAFFLWISPQQVFGAAPRLKGFDPYYFGESGPWYALNLGLRFVRLVIVVPLVEEIFWRGFLLRFLVSSNFTKVPQNAFTWPSCLIVSVCFMLEHHPSDYPAALLTGALFNIVAYRTNSLASCVLAHAITNLLLGVYILETKEWGLW